MTHRCAKSLQPLIWSDRGGYCSLVSISRFISSCSPLDRALQQEKISNESMEDYWFGPASVNVRIATQSGAARTGPPLGVTVSPPQY